MCDGTNGYDIQERWKNRRNVLHKGRLVHGARIWLVLKANDQECLMVPPQNRLDSKITRVFSSHCLVLLRQTFLCPLYGVAEPHHVLATLYIAGDPQPLYMLNLTFFCSLHSAVEPCRLSTLVYNSIYNILVYNSNNTES